MIATRPIRRLAPVVADAIAAGEVIERPASVVKELIENALDAGAGRVEVEIDGGGLVRIAVIDDGQGIPSDDLELATARHATSKITETRDLEAVTTLGFRGEALASIAAVADVRIVTRTATESAAALLRVRCGEVMELGPASGAVGTRVEVVELFATTPARLRFLRSAASETMAATRVVTDLALAHPETAFVCRCDGRVVLRSPGGALRDAMRVVYGARSERDMIDLDAPGDINVRGTISAPHANRGTRNGLVLVVNGRRIHNRSLLVAIDEAYRGLIPSHRHPFGVVVIDLASSGIDVNVHPSKREVRFRDERSVFATVQRACWAALRSAPARAVMADWGEAAPAIGVATLALHDAPALPASAPMLGEPVAGARQHSALESTPPVRLEELRPMRALGQTGGTWMLAEASDAVVLVDPHAAHEKILYTELLLQWQRGAEPDAQLLLIPAVVECEATQMQRFEAHRDFLGRCGFVLEVFGDSMLRCAAVPASAHGADPQRLVGDLLDSLDGLDSLPAAQRHRVAALVACHGAVRFGDRISIPEQQRILDQLVNTPGGVACPHGRPTVIVLHDAALRRAFRRPPV